MALFTESILLDTLGTVTALVAIVYAYFKWIYQYWERKGVPYLEPSIPFGNFRNPLRKTLSTADEIREMYNVFKAKGWKHGGIYNMATPTWMVLDLDLVKHVLTKDFQHFTDRGTYTNEKNDPLSAHLFSIGGAKWRNLRMKLTPTFTSGKMKTMFQTVIDCGLVLETYIKENISSKEAVDIKDILGRFSTDVIGSCAFGLEFKSFSGTDAQFRKYGKKVFETSNLRNMKAAFVLNFPNVARWLGMRITNKEVSDFFMKAVEDTVKYREENNQARKDFLQLLIDIKSNKELQEDEYSGDGKSLTMNEIAAQCFVFFLAGFETSSTTMTFALYELATHQDLQDKVREEINTILAKHDNKMTYDSLSELKYMGKVIDETLRKYSPVPFLIRECVKDYKVPDADIVIEKGTRALIPVPGIHYDEEYHKHSEKFDPERFNEENKAQWPHYAHLPFGEGPRMCIGERFGVMQTKVGLTSILRNFRVKLNAKTRVPLKLAPKSFLAAADGDVWLNIKKL